MRTADRSPAKKSWENLPPSPPMLRERDVRATYGLSTSTIYEMISEGTFPPPIKIGPRVVAWPSNHLAAWLADRAEQSQRAERGALRRAVV